MSNNENIKNVTNKSKLNNRTLGLKRWLSFIVALSMIMSLIILPNITASAAAYTGSYSGGSGSSSNPYQISNETDLLNFGLDERTGLSYCITNDIYVNSDLTKTLKEKFIGTLDGMNHKISLYYKPDKNVEYLSFIGTLTGSIKNLRIASDISGSGKSTNSKSGFAHIVSSGSILEGCIIYDGVNGRKAPEGAGIAYYNYGTIKNCNNQSEDQYVIFMDMYAGIAFHNYGIIDTCSNYYKNNENDYNDNVSGIASYNSGTITNCKSLGVNLSMPTFNGGSTSFEKKYGDNSFSVAQTVNSGVKISYSSDNTNVVTVSSIGDVTIKGAGKAIITASVPENGRYTAGSKNITINVAKLSRSIKTPNTSFTKNYGDSAFYLNASIDLGSMTYTSSNTNVVTVSTTGRVTIQGVGSATITLDSVADNNYEDATSKTINITVNKASRTITMTAASFTKNYGDAAFNLGASISAGSMTYSSSNTNVATVDTDGNVTIKGVGSATITLTSVVNSNYIDVKETIPVAVNAVKPGAPTIEATSGEDGKSTITWTAPDFTGGYAISGYILQRSEDGTNFQTVAQPSSIDTRYVDNGLTNGKTYSYRMVAVNSIGNSDFSSVVTAKPYKVPEAVENLAATALSKNSIGLSWGDCVNDGGDAVTAYEVKVYSDEECANEITSSVDVGTIANKSVTIQGLDKDTTYYFTVSAINGAGTGEAAKVSGTTFTNPDAPTDLSAEVVSSTEIKLTWAAPENDGGEAVTSYNIYYREKAAEGETANEWTKAGNTAELTYVVGELTPGTLYEFKVTAMNGETDEDESPDSAVIEIIPAKEPIAPVIGELISGNASIEISSVEVSDNFGDAVNKYSIYVSRRNEDGSFGEYTKLSEVETKTDSSSNILASGLEICVKKVSKKDALFFTQNTDIMPNF